MHPSLFTQGRRARLGAANGLPHTTRTLSLDISSALPPDRRSCSPSKTGLRTKPALPLDTCSLFPQERRSRLGAANRPFCLPLMTGPPTNPAHQLDTLSLFIQERRSRFGNAHRSNTTTTLRLDIASFLFRTGAPQMCTGSSLYVMRAEGGKVPR